VLPVLCRPAVAVPEHVITLEQTLALARRLYPDDERVALAERLVAGTGVKRRHLVQPIEVTLRHPGVEQRTRVYVREARARVPGVVSAALTHAGLDASQIDAIIYVSCTGFTMPSLTAWMINNLGFREDTCQLPIAQLGCAGGAAAINRAHDFCLARPGANVLVVACEFCSLCYQPDDLAVGSLLSNGLFGDAVAAAVVRGDGDGTGMRLEHTASRLVPGTEGWISYAVKATGFHFLLDRRVPEAMKHVAFAMKAAAAEHEWDVANLDFYVLHAGGPRLLDELAASLGVAPARLARSRATLTGRGNIASAAVLDALRRHFAAGSLQAGARGILAGMGPGITAEITVGSWIAGRRSKPSPRCGEPAMSRA
jgi:1,3,6,8-tetrahydroxynaphthalene synthase